MLKWQPYTEVTENQANVFSQSQLKRGVFIPAYSLQFIFTFIDAQSINHLMLIM